MDSWDEIRTAYHVARVGTVSGAADALGVHHATVIRHIDALEERLGAKLFQRHARGYTPTDVGEDLLRVARATDDQFAQLAARIKGRGDALSGDLTITSLASISYLMVPILAEFQAQYPEIKLRYLTGDRLFRLEYGEAHVAVRAGPAPEQPDNVVQPFVQEDSALYASDAYIAQFGKPSGPEEFAQHRFIGPENIASRAPFSQWMRDTIPAEAIVLRSNEVQVLRQSITAGVGIGFLSTLWARSQSNLIQIMPPDETWRANLWLVTHVDLHRTPKVQTFLKFLKEKAKVWGLQ